MVLRHGRGVLENGAGRLQSIAVSGVRDNLFHGAHGGGTKFADALGGNLLDSRDHLRIVGKPKGNPGEIFGGGVLAVASRTCSGDQGPVARLHLEQGFGA